jgi:hypothetical protein
MDWPAMNGLPVLKLKGRGAFSHAGGLSFYRMVVGLRRTHGRPHSVSAAVRLVVDKFLQTTLVVLLISCAYERNCPFG